VKESAATNATEGSFADGFAANFASVNTSLLRFSFFFSSVIYKWRINVSAEPIE
jgi:hypothetical protein